MKIVFTIQGEGRGHMMQAVAAKEILEKAGHEIIGVFIGKTKNKTLPNFLSKHFQYQTHDAPGFSFKNGSVSTLGTVLESLKVMTYGRSVKRLRDEIKALGPDLVLNFYDPICGLASGSKDFPKTIAIGHQFMIFHPEYTRSFKYAHQLFGIKLLNRIVQGKNKAIALSFWEPKRDHDPKIKSCPPILRERIFNTTKEKIKNRILIYLVTDAYASKVVEFAQANPEYTIDCFTDNGELVIHNKGNLTFHELNDDLFLDKMEEAEYIVCTAGFETISEAFVMGKKVLAVPTQNHIEQKLNAEDASGISFCFYYEYCEDFNLNILKESSRYDDERLKKSPFFEIVLETRLDYIPNGNEKFLEIIHEEC